MTVEISFGGDSKTIHDWTWSAPEWFVKMRAEIDQAAGTPRLRGRHPKK